MAAHVTHSHQADAEEHHSSRPYWLVWIALLILTGLTWYTGRMHISGALILALVIATTKATLVVLFFMHLWEQKGVNRITFVISVLFVVVMLLGVFADVTTRLKTLLPTMEDPNAPAQAHGAQGGTAPAGH